MREAPGHPALGRLHDESLPGVRPRLGDDMIALLGVVLRARSRRSGPA